MQDTSEIDRDYVLGLFEDDLRRVWKEAFPEDKHKEFTKLFGINDGTFLKWLNGTRCHLPSINAIRTFIIYGEKVNTGRDLEVQIKTDHELETTILQHTNLRSLVFVNGDSAFDCMYQVRHAISPSDMRYIHIVLAIGNGTAHPRLVGYDRKQWVSLIQAEGKVKDSTDHNISYQLGFFNTLLRRCVSFYVIYSDKAPVEVIKRVSKKRVCIALDCKTTDVGTFLLSRVRLNPSVIRSCSPVSIINYSETE